jgi:hypothetical protein
MKEGIMEMRKVLGQRIQELVNDGMGIKYAGYCALTDVIKDLYCVTQGIEEWPEDIKLSDGRVDDFHDWATSITETMGND